MTSTTAAPQHPVPFGRRVARAVRRAEVRLRQRLTVHVDDLELRFAVQTPESRRWFDKLCDPARVHEPGVTKLLLELLRPDSVFLDVGSNLGWFTVLAACRCPRGEVHAFDVDGTMLSQLRLSLAQNDSRCEVITRHAAVSDRSGGRVTFAPAQPGNPSTNVVCASDGEDGIETVTLDDHCKQHGVSPDIIKIDVEGAELAVVPGALRTIARCRPAILLEVHPRQIAAGGGSLPDAVVPILELDYDAHVVAEHRRDDGTLQLLTDFDELPVDRPSMLLLQPRTGGRRARRPSGSSTLARGQ